MKIREALDQAGRELSASDGPHIGRRLLIPRAAELSGKKPKSKIPSDYCHNRGYNGNKCSPAENGAIFLWVEDGIYRYVGANYMYEGEILRKPKD